LNPNVDYYAVLGVAPDAETGDIKKAYRQMAEAYHPDRVSTLGPKLQELANEEMKKINEARSILLKEEERTKYDALRKKIADKGVPPPPKGKAAGKKEHAIDLTEDILETQSLIWEIKGMEVDTADAEQMFDDAKFAYQQGNEEKAANLLKDAKATAENARMYKDAMDLIQMSRGKITEAAELGGDIIKANEFYSKTQPAMVNKDYMTAIYYADLTWKQATKAIERYAYETLMGAKDTIKSAQDLGLDVSKVDSVFNQAKPLVKEKKFKNAVAVGQQSSSMVTDIIEKYANYKYEEVTAHYHALHLEQNPEELKKIKPLMGKLDDMYQNKHYVASLRMTRDILTAGQQAPPPPPKQTMQTAPVPKLAPKRPVGAAADGDVIEVWEYMAPEEEVREIPEADRKFSIYERTLYQVWEDGILEEDESLVLRNLRNQHGITEEEHSQLEDKVRRALGL